MNLSKIAFTSFLLLATASVTQVASASARQTPRFLDAVASANNVNRAGSAVYDPTCDDAKVWDAKVIGVDERSSGGKGMNIIVPVDPSLTEGKGGLATYGGGGLISKDRILTAGHVFVNEGVWSISGSRKTPSREEFNKIQVKVPGCDQYYRVRKVIPRNTMVSSEVFNEHSHQDYAIVQLEEKVCRNAQLVELYDSNGTGWDIDVSAYYGENTVPENSGTQMASVESRGSDETWGGVRRPYTARGALVSTFNLNGQEMCDHTADTSGGSSGAPVSVAGFDNQIMVCLHLGPRLNIPGIPTPSSRNNTGIKVTGPFLEWVSKHTGEGA